MQSSSSNSLQKKLIESNIKTQEAASDVVKSVKDLISSLKEAGEASDVEADMNAKLDKLLHQNYELAAKLDELLKVLRFQQPVRPPQQPQGMEPPPLPPWRKL